VDAVEPLIDAMLWAEISIEEDLQRGPTYQVTDGTTQ
jgi:hypothetical protein